MESVLQHERDRAATGHKQEVALRPASYKSSLSLVMPVGTTRQKERREKVDVPAERQHVQAENLAHSNTGKSV